MKRGPNQRRASRRREAAAARRGQWWKGSAGAGCGSWRVTKLRGKRRLTVASSGWIVELLCFFFALTLRLVGFAGRVVGRGSIQKSGDVARMKSLERGVDKDLQRTDLTAVSSRRGGSGRWQVAAG